MSGIEKGGPRPLIPPVEPIVPTQRESGYKEGEERETPSAERLLSVEEGERRWFVVQDPTGTYGPNAQLKTKRSLLTMPQAVNLGLEWDSGEKI